jgi:hypothetical protein
MWIQVENIGEKILTIHRAGNTLASWTASLPYGRREKSS